MAAPVPVRRLLRGDRQGLYRDIGLEVELIEYSPGVTPIDQLIGGRVDFAVADTGALIYRSTGVPLVALAAIFQHSPSILLTREQDGIRTLADLRGRNVMLSGGYMNAELMAMLSTAGIGPGDFRMEPADTSVGALVDGRVDAYNAYIVNEPYLLDILGVPYRVFQPRDHGVDFYGDLLITTERRIAEDPDMVRAFRAATLGGWGYAAEHPEEVVDLILERYNTQGKSREHLLYEAREAIGLILPNVVPPGYMNVERWRRIEDAFLAQGLVSGRTRLSDFLYGPDELPWLLQAANRHRGEIAIVGVLLVFALLVAHNLYLRARIDARTRELQEAKRRAEEEARSDVLTGIANRRHFIEVMNHDIAQAERRDLPLTLLVIDIDRFKDINDEHGHAAGDEALRGVAAILQGGARLGDVAARIGGEEFALGCPGTAAAEARSLAECLRRQVEGTAIPVRGAAVQITISVGLASRRCGETLDQLLHNADRALYEAKQDGRNRVREYRGRDAETADAPPDRRAL